jgi:hypothetical protein
VALVHDVGESLSERKEPTTQQEEGTVQVDAHRSQAGQARRNDLQRPPTVIGVPLGTASHRKQPCTEPRKAVWQHRMQHRVQYAPRNSSRQLVTRADQ